MPWEWIADEPVRPGPKAKGVGAHVEAVARTHPPTRLLAQPSTMESTGVAVDAAKAMEQTAATADADVSKIAEVTSRFFFFGLQSTV